MLILAATGFLTACATTNFEAVCPTLFTYSAGQQDRAATALEGLPDGSVLIEMFGDYAAARQEIRVCRNG
jgi:hypothetical protein